MENALQLMPPPPLALLKRLCRLLRKQGQSHMLRRSRYQNLQSLFGQEAVTSAWLTLLLAPSLQSSERDNIR